MVQSSREIYWSAILADFRRSGLTHVKFCRLRRMSLHSFRKWLYHLLRRDRLSRAVRPGKPFRCHDATTRRQAAPASRGLFPGPALPRWIDRGFRR